MGYKAGAKALRLADVPEGTTLSWVAVPEPNEPAEAYKASFTRCTGQWTISPTTNKVALNGSCDHKTPKTTASNALIDVTLTNNLSEPVSIWVSGTDDQISGRPAPAGFSHSVGKAAAGAKVSWLAKASTQDCSGDIQVSSSSKTISIDGNKCKVKAGPVHNGKVTTWRIGVKNDAPDKIEVFVIDRFDSKMTDFDKTVPLAPGNSGAIELIPVNDEARVGVMVKDEGNWCTGGDEKLIVIKPGNSIHVQEVHTPGVTVKCKTTKQ